MQDASQPGIAASRKRYSIGRIPWLPHSPNVGAGTVSAESVPALTLGVIWPWQTPISATPIGAVVFGAIAVAVIAVPVGAVPAIAVPAVAASVTITVIARRYRITAAIGSSTPVAFAPETPMSNLIPVAIGPFKARTGVRRRIRNHRWSRVSVPAHADTNREVCFGEQ